jgi:protein required for attachment to host cells
MAIWVLVADNSRAHLFSAQSGNGALAEVESFVHAESRLHDRDLTSDLPGRAFDSLGGGRHAMEQRVDPKDEQAIRFAEELIAHLEDGRVHHRYDRLYVAAPPALLGMLRERYGQIAPLVAGEVDKHLTQCTPDELRAHLPDRL